MGRRVIWTNAAEEDGFPACPLAKLARQAGMEKTSGNDLRRLIWILIDNKGRG